MFLTHLDDPMAFLNSIFRNPPTRLYLLGHALILLGAWLMDLTASVLPMALCTSAALMLSVPLLKQIASRWLYGPARRPER